ncbi:MAG: phosphatidylglycerol lysyltransferase domain-containing protein [Muribaculaceae bacterium]|nr:phosphatidylglycerol lysyltransferase domain-containing protein [Muribaculaceae bacterium]
MDSRFSSRPYIVSTLPSPMALHFKPLTTTDIPTILPYLLRTASRTCDFTIGGLLMWTGYFDYSYAIVGDTLFIKGVTEDDVTRPAFSLPVGDMELEDAVELLRDYCRLHDAMPLTFSAVPEQFTVSLSDLGATEITLLTDWSDYLYDAQALSTLSGKKLSKKRNHVNRFMADNPGFKFEPITDQNIEAARRFYHDTRLPLSKPALADVEREQVINVLNNIQVYPFEGAILSTPAHGVVAFTLGETIGDTLYVHIEKMDHEIPGAGETINKLFAEMMTARHPEIRFINREEDTGDPGLRYAKESYHPLEMLRKFNVTMI